VTLAETQRAGIHGEQLAMSAFVAAIVPLVTLLLAVLQRQERLRPPGVVGAAAPVLGPTAP
jgi:drug/metabolite transporter (DMT)-like permease